MSKVKHIIITVCCLLCVFGNKVTAQELNCQVEINADQIQNANKQVFETLKEAINEYMNTNKFSNAQFSVNEKIDCRLFFTIKEYNDNTMIGDLQIQSSRPVYNSTYTTTLINFKDSKIEFSYQENEPLVYSENNMGSNLTAILNFYAYLIIAVDFDSFSPNGGDPYYEKAQNVVQMAQSSGESGWKAFEDTKNRPSVLSSYTDPNTSIIRKLLYEYHRLGLDEMVLSPDKGRAKISSTLDYLNKIYDVAPMSVALSIFKDAKLDELVNLYTKASQTERDNAYEILSSLYPTENDRVTKIKNGTNK